MILHEALIRVNSSWLAHIDSAVMICSSFNFFCNSDSAKACDLNRFDVASQPIGVYTTRMINTKLFGGGKETARLYLHSAHCRDLSFLETFGGRSLNSTSINPNSTRSHASRTETNQLASPVASDAAVHASNILFSSLIRL